MTRKINILKPILAIFAVAILTLAVFGTKISAYTTAEELETALNTAADGEIITLTKDITGIAETIVISNSNNITLDLNGQTLSGSTDQFIQVSQDTNLTIKDSETAGMITASDVTAIKNNGTLNITDGTVESGDYTIMNSFTGILNISGGTVSSTGPNKIVINNKNTTTISGGTVTGKIHKVISKNPLAI